MKLASIWFNALKLLLLVGFTVTPSSAKSEDICRFFADNTKVRDPLSCNQYITCIDSISYYSTCTTSTPYFDKDTSKCVKTLSNDDKCQLSCEGNIDQFIGDPTSCYGYYYCADAKTPIHGKCPDKTHFNTATQSCTYKEYSACKLDKFDICAIARTGVTVASERDCRQYFECNKKGELTAKECKAGTYYDAGSGKCLAKWMVDCPKHPLPDNVCGTTKKPLKNKLVTDGATCRGYYYCADKNGIPDPAPIWGQCPENAFFNPNTETCGNPQDISCPLGADRCDGRTLPFVSSSDKGCREYLRCLNGKTVQELSCGNRFFDENMIACISTPITYKSCST